MPFPMGIVRRRKVAMVTHGQLPRRHYHSTKERVRSATLINMMKYAVPAVLALPTLQYQRKLHPAALWCFVAAITVYWLIIEAMKRRKTPRRYFHTLRSAALASGTLSALSLLSVLLPHPVSLLPLLIWLLFAPFWAIYCNTIIIAKIKAFAKWIWDKAPSSKNPSLPV